jgi:hypothetical protein
MDQVPGMDQVRTQATSVSLKAEAHYGALPDRGIFSPHSVLALARLFPMRADLDAEPPASAEASAAAQEAQAEAEPALPVPSIAESVPVPLPRPAELGIVPEHRQFQRPSRRLATQPAAPGRPNVASLPADNRSFFEKFFGMPQRSGSVLAYAAPESPFGNNLRGAAPGIDRWTAVYDISAHTVYMPDGTRLEAHSGLGSLLDDPRHVNEHNRGATPPNVYELTPREQLFHGVQALRLTPLSGQVYGRVGLLAHTYMLGPRGDSNGCVSFRNYNAFLRAFQSGQVKRLAVVAHMN